MRTSSTKAFAEDKCRVSEDLDRGNTGWQEHHALEQQLSKSKILCSCKRACLLRGQKEWEASRRSGKAGLTLPPRLWI